MSARRLPRRRPASPCTRQAAGIALAGVRSLLVVVRAVVPVLNLLVPAGSAFHLSDYAVPLSARSCATRSCALAMDLIWGYTGILSLGPRRVLRARRLRDGHVPDAPDRPRRQVPSDLPDFMVFLDWKEAALALDGFSDSFVATLLLVVARAGPARLRVRLLRLPLAHQGRVLLDHHAGADLRGDAAVLPQRDRLRRQQRLHRLQAHPRHADRRRRRCAWRCSCITGLHAARLLPAGALASSTASSAACCRRSATPRAASCSPATTRCATSSSIWTLSAVMCGIAGALYVPQVGIINPSEMSPANSIEMAIWAAVGGRGTLIGADRRRLLRQRREELVHRGLPGVLAVLPRRAVHRRHAVPAARHRRPVAQPNGSCAARELRKEEERA